MNFYCTGCTSLTSLDGAPQKVGRDFYCSSTKISNVQKNAYKTWLKTNPKENYKEMKAESCMIDLKKMYEDAVMAAGATPASGGEIATPGPASDADIVKGGMTTDDVLGKECDHHKHGYLGPGCFHVPSKTCKMFKREILAGKKKKKQKNDYAKGMTIIGEGPILHQYKGQAKRTADKIKSCINDDIYLDKLYFIEQFGFACRLNSKGYFHIYRPVKVTLDGAFSHYSIKHMMLTDKNELKELSMFGDFKTKDDALKEIEKTAKQGQ